MEKQMNGTIGPDLSAIGFIVCWVYCHEQYKKRTLSTKWYMWPLSLIIGSVFGVCVYARYRGNQKIALAEAGATMSTVKKPAKPTNRSTP